jgi:hypothetical protein
LKEVTILDVLKEVALPIERGCFCYCQKLPDSL